MESIGTRITEVKEVMGLFSLVRGAMHTSGAVVLHTAAIAAYPQMNELEVTLLFVGLLPPVERHQEAAVPDQTPAPEPLLAPTLAAPTFVDASAAAVAPALVDASTGVEAPAAVDVSIAVEEGLLEESPAAAELAAREEAVAREEAAVVRRSAALDSAFEELEVLRAALRAQQEQAAAQEAANTAEALRLAQERAEFEAQQQAKAGQQRLAKMLQAAQLRQEAAAMVQAERDQVSQQLQQLQSQQQVYNADMAAFERRRQELESSRGHLASWAELLTQRYLEFIQEKEDLEQMAEEVKEDIKESRAAWDAVRGERLALEAERSKQQADGPGPIPLPAVKTCNRLSLSAGVHQELDSTSGSSTLSSEGPSPRSSTGSGLTDPC